MEAQDRDLKRSPVLHESDLRLRLLTADLAEDDLESYRRREAAWISLAVHGIVIGLLVLSPKWAFRSSPAIVPIVQKDQPTFLQMPSDLQKVKAPKTDILSDKNRVAQTRTPTPNREQLRKILDANRPGPPVRSTTPPPPPAPVQQATQQTPATQQGTAPAQTAPPPPQNAKMEAPDPAPKKTSPFAVSSPGSTVSQAIHSAAGEQGSKSVTFGGGEYGAAPLHPKTDTRGNLDILSDTLGVDFGPYMQRLRVTVMDHWEPLIPEVAQPPIMKKGVVVIEFSIMKDGRVQGLKIVATSGDTALDRAAYGAITSATPLPNLPQNFAGDFLTIRARFYYNPDRNQFE